MLLSDWPAALKCGSYPQVSIGSLRCHRKGCESTRRNSASCPKLKHLVIVLDLVFECGWRGKTRDVEICEGVTNQYGAGRRAETQIFVEVDRTAWLPAALKLNALSPL
jgi:hypothetical protein